MDTCTCKNEIRFPKTFQLYRHHEIWMARSEAGRREWMRLYDFSNIQYQKMWLRYFSKLCSNASVTNIRRRKSFVLRVNAYLSYFSCLWCPVPRINQCSIAIISAKSDPDRSDWKPCVEAELAVYDDYFVLIVFSGALSTEWAELKLGTEYTTFCKKSILYVQGILDKKTGKVFLKSKANGKTNVIK